MYLGNGSEGSDVLEGRHIQVDILLDRFTGNLVTAMKKKSTWAEKTPWANLHTHSRKVKQLGCARARRPTPHSPDNCMHYSSNHWHFKRELADSEEARPVTGHRQLPVHVTEDSHGKQ